MLAVTRADPLQAHRSDSGHRLLAGSRSARFVTAEVRAENAAWLEALRASPERRDAALSRLHRLLVGAAHREAMRRLESLPDAVRADVDDVCLQAADDALVKVLNSLESFRGDSRFTTWAYTFAVFKVSSRLRRHEWRGHRVELDDHGWECLVDHHARNGPEYTASCELMKVLQRAILERLTNHQRLIFESAVLECIPINVLAIRLGSTRGAIYKTLHDARRKLRVAVVDAGYLEFER
jgi:RNA polymerase sigma-70 factor, ECF subfamily